MFDDDDVTKHAAGRQVCLKVGSLQQSLKTQHVDFILTHCVDLQNGINVVGGSFTPTTTFHTKLQTRLFDFS